MKFPGLNSCALGTKPLFRPVTYEYTDKQRLLDSFDSDRSPRHSCDEAPPYALQAPSTRSSMRLSRRTLFPVFLLIIITVSFLVGRHSNAARSAWPTAWPTFRSRLLPTQAMPLDNLLDVKPADIKIVGLVFFGRRIFADILDCYLRRNLAVNGGFLDEVHFVIHTADQTDVAWLEDLVKTSGMEKHYKLIYDDQKLRGGTVWGTFSNLWGRYGTEDDTMYIKIDDDMVWIDDEAIPHLVSALIAHPEAHSIQANVVNSQWNQWYHYTTEAILPYLPEPESARTLNHNSPSWKDSELPDYPVSALPPGQGPALAADYAPEVSNQRWLPLPRTTRNLMRTPWGTGESLPDPKTSRKGAVNWQIAAQEHFSLFHHIEHDSLGSYSFGRNTDGLWNTWWQHYNVNFMAFYGKTMKKRPFWGSPKDAQYIRNDEVALTQIVPKELGMPVLVDTRAMVAHYAFHLDGQREKLLKTDILARYRALANERVCGANNQKRPLDQGVWGDGYDVHHAETAPLG